MAVINTVLRRPYKFENLFLKVLKLSDFQIFFKNLLAFTCSRRKKKILSHIKGRNTFDITCKVLSARRMDNIQEIGC